MVKSFVSTEFIRITVTHWEREFLEKGSEIFGQETVPLFEIAKRHPADGVSRTVSELRARGYEAHHKVLERLNGVWDLSVVRRLRRPKPSSIQRLLKATESKIHLVLTLSEILDFEVLYTDITEIVYQKGQGKAKLLPIKDHTSKLVLGHEVAKTADTELALAAW